MRSCVSLDRVRRPTAHIEPTGSSLLRAWREEPERLDVAAADATTPRGHAVECRIYAEDPEAGFMPSPGRITSWHPPGGPGIRVDSHAYQNYFVPPNYDSMIGKVIAYGDTRAQALARMRIALSEMIVEGIKTNIPLHQELLIDDKFMQGGTSIHYLGERMAKRK